jgi:hypothetical protein
VKRTHKGPLRDVLAKNVRRLRAMRRLSQEALAHECGINRTYLVAIASPIAATGFSLLRFVPCQAWVVVDCMISPPLLSISKQILESGRYKVISGLRKLTTSEIEQQWY